MNSPALDQLVARTASRIGALGATRGASVGAGVAALWMGACVVWPSDRPLGVDIGVSLAVVALGAAVGWWRTGNARHRAAHELEARFPAAGNLLVTATELLGTSNALATRTEPAVSTMVVQRATKLASTINVASLLPARSSLQALGASALVWAAMVALSRSPASLTVQRGTRSAVAAVTGSVDINRVTVRVTSPRYAQRAAESLRDPVRVEALAGSTLAFSIEATADTILAVSRDSSGEHIQRLARAADGAFALSLTNSVDGYLALEPRTNDGRLGTRRLIVLSARRDESPRVRILEPAKDIVVPDAKRTLAIRIEADDDLALGSLRLKYTKVSGNGERFTFSEGEIPISITKASGAQWNARASLALEPLLQEAGDLVVYRAVATDTRPGAEPVESDAYIAELATPGGIAAFGFSVDPDEDRYALSQQMIVLKTERLIAKQKTTPVAALADESAQLAAEQRRVRAEFVFMMGGEFEQAATGEVGEELDETAEAEGEGDLAAGRMANRGRLALVAAIRNMSHAAVSLTTADLVPALAAEKKALLQLQDAFARSRFLMRALSQREALDLTRRLTGKLDSTARVTAAIPEGERNAQAIAWRAVLADVLALAASPNEKTARAQYTTLAERALQIDPSSPRAQRIASQLTSSSVTALDSATTAITAILRESLRPSAPAPMATDARRLQSALDAARARSGAMRGGKP